MYTIKFFEKSNGECPFQMFLNGRNKKTEASFFKLLDILIVQGTNLKQPYSNPLRDGIRELRIKYASYQYHALYFWFHRSNTYVITHGIITQSDVVPDVEIDRAIKYRNEFLG